MSGNGKHQEAMAYHYSQVVAINVLNGISDLTYTEFRPEEGESGEKVVLLPSQSNPEQEVIKIQLFESLSLEAQGLIKLIFGIPSEIFNDISENITKKKHVYHYLKSKNWKNRRIAKVFKEIKNYLHELQ
jgi:hypothetical protein